MGSVSLFKSFQTQALDLYLTVLKFGKGVTPGHLDIQALCNTRKIDLP